MWTFETRQIMPYTVEVDLNSGFKAVLAHAIADCEEYLDMKQIDWERPLFGQGTMEARIEYLRRILIELGKVGKIDAFELAIQLDRGEFGDARLYVEHFNAAMYIVWWIVTLCLRDKITIENSGMMPLASAS